MWYSLITNQSGGLYFIAAPGRRYSKTFLISLTLATIRTQNYIRSCIIWKCGNTFGWWLNNAFSISAKFQNCCAISPKILEWAKFFKHVKLYGTNAQWLTKKHCKCLIVHWKFEGKWTSQSVTLILLSGIWKIKEKMYCCHIFKWTQQICHLNSIYFLNYYKNVILTLDKCMYICYHLVII